MTSDAPDYAVRYDVTRPETQSRITNFPLFIGLTIRLILLIPQIVVLIFIGLVAAILFPGHLCDPVQWQVPGGVL